MKKFPIVLALILSGCGKTERPTNNYITPKQEPKLESTCAPIYVQSYYNLQLDLKVLKHYRTTLEASDLLSKAKVSFRKFNIFSDVASCFVLENGKLNKIETVKFLTETENYLDEVTVELKAKKLL